MGDKTNRACVLVKANTIEIRNLEIPTIATDSENVLIQVQATGICGSDVKNYLNGGIGEHMLKSPIVLGHESAGTIIQVGTRVTSLSVGDHVAIEPLSYCRKCYNCKSGRSNICTNFRFASAFPTDGTLCQYYACEAELALKIPNSLSWEEAGCIQPLAIAIQAAKRAKFTAGQTMAIFGCGPLGLLIMAVARAYGVSKILAFGRTQPRIDFAKKFAADYASSTPVPPKDQSKYRPWADEFKNSALKDAGLDPGWGVDVVVESSGAESCIHAGVAFLHNGGTFLQCGFSPPNVSFPMLQAITKELDVITSLRYTSGCFQTAVNLLVTKKIDVKPMITSVLPLAKTEEALKALNGGGTELKVVIMNQT